MPSPSTSPARIPLAGSYCATRTVFAVIPVKLLKKGGVSSSSKVLTEEEYDALQEELRQKLCTIAQDILDGRVDASPIRQSADYTACSYCPYRNVCGFDVRIPGYEYREL